MFFAYSFYLLDWSLLFPEWCISCAFALYPHFWNGVIPGLSLFVVSNQLGFAPQLTVAIISEERAVRGIDFRKLENVKFFNGVKFKLEQVALPGCNLWVSPVISGFSWISIPLLAILRFSVFSCLPFSNENSLLKYMTWLRGGYWDPCAKWPFARTDYEPDFIFSRTPDDVGTPFPQRCVKLRTRNFNFSRMK